MSRELAQLLRQKIDEFDHHLKLNDYSPQTRKNYRCPLLELATWVEADEQLKNLTDLTPQVLQNYWSEVCFRQPRRKQKRKRGQPKTLSATSLRLYAAALRRFFQELTRRGELLTDPSFSLRGPKGAQEIRGAVLSQREVLKLLMAIELDTLEGLRDRAVVELLYATGVRRAELSRLNIEDLNLEDGWLHVRGKGGRPRVVPVGREAELALRAYLRDARPKMAGPDETALFVAASGERYRARHLGELLHRLAAEAGIKKRVTPHVLRHTCATHMLAGKADIRYIQALLGHVSIQTTQAYTHVEISDLRQVLRACHPRERDL